MGKRDLKYLEIREGARERCNVGGQPIRIPLHGRSIAKLAAGVGKSESSAASISLSVTWDRRRFSEFALLACSVVIAPLIAIQFAPCQRSSFWNGTSRPLKQIPRLPFWTTKQGSCIGGIEYPSSESEQTEGRSALKRKQEPVSYKNFTPASKATHAPGASHLAIEGQSYASVNKFSSHRCSTELN